MILETTASVNAMQPPTFVQGFHDAEAVARMTYHPLGDTGLQLSRFSLGGTPFGGQYGEAREQACIDTIHLALKSGVNYIDTSPWYGNGRSEEVLGKALKDVPRSSFYIGTKVGRYEPVPERMFDFSAKRVAQSVDRSLQLLGLDYVDLIQVHDFEFAENLDIIVEETLPALQKVVDSGKARFIGITSYSVSLLKELVERSPVKISAILSYARNTLIDDTLEGFMPFFKSRNIGVICASPVAMRLLTYKPVLPEWHPAPQYMRDASHSAALCCKEAGVDLARLAVQHALRLEGVTTHLQGNDNCDILRQNLNNFLTPPTSREEELRKAVKERFFDPLPAKHWEGVDPAKHWETMRQLRAQSAGAK
ncbi:uncharacterized protein LOC135106838 isoform X1 [Scylla paramamosain]